MAFVFGKTSLAKLEEINPILKELATKALAKSTVDFGIPSTGGKRTAEEQKALYDKGYSKADGTIKKTYHQSGNAVDLVPVIDGKMTWDSIQAFIEINEAVMAAWSEMNVSGWTLTWGGNWKTFIDRPHYEIKKK